jgi:Ca-activated chloride channel family protein
VTAFTWKSPEAFWLLLLVPLVGAWSVWTARTRVAALRYPVARVLAAAGPGLRGILRRGLPLLRMAAVALAVVALARPQTLGARLRDLSVEGIDIMIALDLSTSMEAADFRPNNRIFVAKETLNEVLSSRVNDRIGLVVFAGAAYTQAPLTLDYGVLREVVKQLRTRVLEDGTAIGDALAVSLNRLRDSDAKSKVVVLITDGDNNAGRISPLDAAAMARALHIPVFTILVGKGGRCRSRMGPTCSGIRATGSWRSPSTRACSSRSPRRPAASITGRPTASRSAGLSAVLDRLDKSKLLEGGASANYKEEFPPFLLAAFLCAGLELLLRSTVLRVFP